MKVLDLFCGTKSIANNFKNSGFNTATMDFEEKFKPDFCVDVMEWDYKKELNPGQFEVVWASPPCQGFSVARIGYNWQHKPIWGHKHTLFPKTDKAQNGINIIERTIKIIRYLNPKYWFIENPMGALRKQPIMQKLPRNTITYCQYGDFRMKPTDIWGIFPREFPIMKCNYGDDCHEASPRGMKNTGTQRLKTATERAMIPDNFCRMLADYIILEMEEDAS